MSNADVEYSKVMTPQRIIQSGGPSGPTPLPVAVIGAGPYGLSIAAHLRHRGIEARVFGETMGGWRQHMPSGMFLKSVASASNLSAPTPGFTLRDFCVDSGVMPLMDEQPIPIDLFVRYGLWFQRQLVPDVEPRRVVRLARADGRFDLLLDSGEEFCAGSVVMATGLVSFARLPPEVEAVVPHGPSATGAISHACQHRDLSTFAGKQVAVIGGGQSALETAALLHESGARVQVIVRKPRLLYANAPSQAEDRQVRRLIKPPSPLGDGWSLLAVSRAPHLVRHLPVSTRRKLVATVLGPSGAWWLRDRVDGQIETRAGHRINRVSLTGGRVGLHLGDVEGRESDISVDHVIAATGYRVDLDTLDFIETGLLAQVQRVDGSPRLSAQFESTVPGLFFIGLAAAATFGPVLRFVCGSEFASRRASAGVARRAGVRS